MQTAVWQIGQSVTQSYFIGITQNPEEADEHVACRLWTQGALTRLLLLSVYTKILLIKHNSYIKIQTKNYFNRKKEKRKNSLHSKIQLVPFLWPPPHQIILWQINYNNKNLTKERMRWSLTFSISSSYVCMPVQCNKIVNGAYIS